MEQPQIIVRKKTRRSPAGSERRKVIVLNDEVTSWDFVIRMLMEIFFMDIQEAERTTAEIDRRGSAVVGVYPKDIAESKAEAGMAMARAENFPLRIITQKA